MLTKTEFITSITKETTITSHLVSKLKPEHLAFRLTPAQRSTQELIEYMAVQLAGSTNFFMSGSWDAWGTYAAQVKGLTPADFPAAMERQLAEVARLLAAVNEHEFATRIVKTPRGLEMPLAQGLLEVTLKFSVGYKMQLFLQAKAAGLATLGTSNLWHGVDKSA